ncbi:DNA polymerase III subunit alpha, partial [Sulfurivirga sp.]|uniref:DNA polymerase III subunit alpha n=1 Tax=Sulfurivirga sp. TaxID=2614236 RepID=UPI0025E59D7D
DRTGYLNLSHLISQAWLKNQQIVGHETVPVVRRAWLEAHAEGLIALLGPKRELAVPIAAGKPNLTALQVEWWQKLFGDRLYLEFVRTGREGEAAWIEGALQLVSRYGLPAVATNDVRFATPEDFTAHEVRTCIHTGHVLDDGSRPQPYSEEQYFRSTEEMEALFADLPGALENTVEIARRCNVQLELGTYYLPDFPVPDGMTLDDYFVQVCREGLEQRLQFLFGDLPPEQFEQKRQQYHERLRFELDTILQMGFPGYFLIVADFIQWAKDNGIPVGPGRGSGAGSLVAYALKITDLDPIAYDLLFERFLNPERVSMPDFDVDFCMERRDEVIDYVARHYGRDHVSQIVTFGTMAAKAVVRDVGRVLGLPYGMVDGVAKLIPDELGITLKKALEMEPDLKARYEQEDEVRELLDLALRLEGTVRNTGKHAGGVVIGPRPLETFCPLLADVDGSGVVTQLDKNDVEAIGLVKFDFLGLRTLTIIDWALQAINEGKQPGDEGYVDISRIPLDDRDTFELIKTGRTTGVFQLESSGMQDLIRRLKPDCFEDIIALVALFRPGPLESGMVDNFIARKHGKEKVSYPDPNYQHEWLKPILEPTYGVILYQEQVMQIAQVLAGYTLGGADLLRRAMGKKKPEEMAKQREVFREGAIKKGVDPELAMKIFDLVEKFAGYGFNKSHSAAYALVSYQSAWLKTHYPAQFMAAQISSDMDNTDKVVHMLNECRSMGLEVLPPDINRCDIAFRALPDGRILYGLAAIKGVGAAALEGLVRERAENGPYRDLFDLVKRVDTGKVNRRVLEALIRAGALDSLHDNRQAMLTSLTKAFALAEQFHADRAAGQTDLFGGMDDMDEEHQLVDVPEMAARERLKGEKATLGHYVTGHPIDLFRAELERMGLTPINQLTVSMKSATVGGLVVGVRKRRNRKGEPIAIVTIDDRTGRQEFVLNARQYESVKEWLAEDVVVIVEGRCEADSYNDGIRLMVENIRSLMAARMEKARALKLWLAADQADDDRLDQLTILLESYAKPDGLPVVVEYDNGRVKGQLKFGPAFSVLPDDALLEAVAAQKFPLEIVYPQS